MLNRYRTLLKNWIRSQREYIASPADRPDLAFYGTGTDRWGIQTHMKGFSAFAVIAADDEAGHEDCGYTQSELIDLSLKMLRFTLESHITGSYHCMDGESAHWGHHWLAALATERMLHGVDALWQYLTDGDKKRLREVLLSEADYLVDERAVEANEISPNVPESNLWSGAALHRAALMYPDAPRADEYRAHGTKLLLNSISVPSDRTSDKLYAGKPMSEWFVGANFFEEYALNHHSYMNVGYMVICLSNMAMFHFACKRMGVEAPPELYHHFADLWKLVRTFIFDDGRLYRIGGDTRVRYCYCQDYLTPVLALVRDVLGEDMSSEESGWLSMLETETAYNGDGSFLGERCELFRERSILYYTRLESDRACTLSMVYLWRKLYPEIFTRQTTKEPKYNLWEGKYHGSYYVRGEKRMAAFTWISAERPMGSIVPTSDSSMAESKFNLVSFANGVGISNFCAIGEHGGRLIDGGFITSGALTYVTAGLLEENDSQNENAENRLFFCALPDDRTVVTMQYCRAIRRCRLLSTQPLNYNLPNDIWNGEKRLYERKDGSLTVDGRLTVTAAYGGEVRVRHNEKRTIGVQHINMPKISLTNTSIYGDRGMLRVDQLLIGGSDDAAWYDAGSTVFDFGAVIRTDAQAAVTESFSVGDIRAVKVIGADDRLYIAAVNFGDAEFCSEIFGVKLSLGARECRLLADRIEL